MELYKIPYSLKLFEFKDVFLYPRWADRAGGAVFCPFRPVSVETPRNDPRSNSDPNFPRSSVLLPIVQEIRCSQGAGRWLRPVTEHCTTVNFRRKYPQSSGVDPNVESKHERENRSALETEVGGCTQRRGSFLHRITAPTVLKLKSQPWTDPCES